MKVSERLGQATGVPLASGTGLGSVLRQSRLFHPRGHLFEAQVTPAEGLVGWQSSLANRLSGSALVRLSNALWKDQREGFDVLGLALRFAWRPHDQVEVRSQHQDILLATIQHPWTMPSAPFLTRTDSFFANHYYSVSHFRLGDGEILKFRVTPVRIEKASYSSRAQELFDRLKAGQARFVFEVGPRFRWGQWRVVAEIQLRQSVALNQEALRFSPYHTGQNIFPAGFVNGLRWATYWASQKARPRH